MDNKENSMKREGENREAYGWRDKKKWLWHKMTHPGEKIAVADDDMNKNYKKDDDTMCVLTK